MTARWPAASNCRRPAGCGATGAGARRRSIRPGSRRWHRASRSTASPMARSAPQLERQQGSNAWLDAVAAARARTARCAACCEHLGYPVTRLIRVAYGPFQLGHLARGDGRGSADKGVARAARRLVRGARSAEGEPARSRAARVGNRSRELRWLSRLAVSASTTVAFWMRDFDLLPDGREKTDERRVD